MELAYLRIKRLKTTYFVTVRPRDTILEVKATVAAQTQKSIPELQLLRLEKIGAWKVLQDSTVLQDAGFRNNDIMALSFRQAAGDFEPVQITLFDQEEMDT